MSSKVIACYFIFACYLIHIIAMFATSNFGIIIALPSSVENGAFWYFFFGLPFIFSAFIGIFVYISKLESDERYKDLPSYERDLNGMQESILLVLLILHILVCAMNIFSLLIISLVTMFFGSIIALIPLLLHVGLLLLLCIAIRGLFQNGRKKYNI